MSAWIENLKARRGSGRNSFLVTVMDVRGSAPREAGAKMLVTATDLIGTIGGGQLEYQCTGIACERLGSAGASTDDAASAPFVRAFPLGANCGQCCGGVVDVLFERLPAKDPAWLADLMRFYDERVPAVVATAVGANGVHYKYLITRDNCIGYAAPLASVATITAAARRMVEQGLPASRIQVASRTGSSLTVLLEPIMPNNFNLAVFGAGHVGSAVVGAMADLDCNLRWIDSRRDVFPEVLPENVTRIETACPEREVAAMPAGSFFLVMTHSHALDYEICDRVLRRDDFAYLGLIGSKPKRRRFERLMRKQGMPQPVLDRLTCPIGISGITGKKPREIAIAVAAELLRTKDALAEVAGHRNLGNPDNRRQKNVHVL